MARNNKRKNAKVIKKVLTKEVWSDVSFKIFQNTLLRSPPAIAIRMMIVSKQVKKFLEENHQKMPIFAFSGRFAVEYMTPIQRFKVFLDFCNEDAPREKNEGIEKSISIVYDPNETKDLILWRIDTQGMARNSWQVFTPNLDYALKLMLKRVFEWYYFNKVMLTDVSPEQFTVVKDALKQAIPVFQKISYLGIEYFATSNMISKSQIEVLVQLWMPKFVMVKDNREMYEGLMKVQEAGGDMKAAFEVWKKKSHSQLAFRYDL